MQKQQKLQNPPLKQQPQVQKAKPVQTQIKQVNKSQNQNKQKQAQPLKANNATQSQNQQIINQHKEESKTTEVIPVKETFKLQVSSTVKLTQALVVLDQDRRDNKISLLLDETGNLFTFFKYKGEVIDISEFIVKEGICQAKRSENQERARKIITIALKFDGLLVLFFDLGAINLVEYFKDCQFFADTASLFNYEKLLKEDFYKQQILKVAEDIDYLGNKGGFYAKGKEFRFCILHNSVNQKDPDEVINALGLASIKELFKATIVEG